MKIVTVLLPAPDSFFLLTPPPPPAPSCSARLLICICPKQQTLYIQRHSVSIQRWEHYHENLLYSAMYIHSTSLQDWALLQKRSIAWLVPLLKDTRGDMSRNRLINSCILFLAFCLLAGSCWPIQTVYMLLTKQVWLLYVAVRKQSSAYLQ